MKRFDVLPEYGSVIDLHQVECSDGEYVEADIAQELYNALKFFQDIDSVDSLMIFEDMVDRILAKVDGE